MPVPDCIVLRQSMYIVCVCEIGIIYSVMMIITGAGLAQEIEADRSMIANNTPVIYFTNSKSR